MIDFLLTICSPHAASGSASVREIHAGLKIADKQSTCISLGPWGCLSYAYSPKWQPAPFYLNGKQYSVIVLTSFELSDTTRHRIKQHVNTGKLLPADIECPYVWIAWDNNEIVVASDPIAKETAFHAQAREQLLVASEPAILLEHPHVSAEVDLGIMAERLAGNLVTRHQTLYRAIKWLPGGKYFKVDKSDPAIRTETWFRFAVDRADIPPPEELAPDIYKALYSGLNTLVGSTAQSKIALHFSGGLDSSILAGLLHEAGSASDATALMSRYEGMANDESYYQQAVLNAVPIKRKIFNNREFDPDRDVIEQQVNSKLPLIFPDPEVDDARRWAVDNGAHFIVTGVGGDEFFQFFYESLLEMLITTRVFANLRNFELRDWVASIRLSQKHLPHFARAWRRKRHLPEWINAGFAQQVNLADRLEHAREPFLSVKKREHRLDFFLNGGAGTIWREFNAIKRRHFGFEHIEPYYDPRFIEKVCLLDNQSLFNKNNASDFDSRGFQRKLFSGVLPEELQLRRDKSTFDVRLGLDLQHPWCRHRINNLSLARDGFLNQKSISNIYYSYCDAFDKNTTPSRGFANKLWTIICMDDWWSGL